MSQVICCPKKGTLGIAFAFRADNGDSIDTVIWVTPASSERALETLDTLGFGQEQLDQVENLDRVKEFTKGNRVSIVVEDETYMGNTAAKVKWINKIGGKKVANVHSKSALFAMLKGQTAPLVSTPRSAQPQNMTITDDDVPF